MSENRFMRLLGTIATVAGIIGITLVWTTNVLKTEGTIVFPIAIILGIVTLYKYRPKKRRKTFHQ